MRNPFVNKVKASVDKNLTPAPELKAPPVQYEPKATSGYSVTIKQHGVDEPFTVDGVRQYYLGASMLTLELSDRNSFYYTLVNTPWFSISKGGDL